MTVTFDKVEPRGTEGRSTGRVDLIAESSGHFDATKFERQIKHGAEP